MTCRLVARLDNVGDVLLAGPAVRAVAATGERVLFLAGPAGAEAARLLPGVDHVLVLDAPWVSFDAPPVAAGPLASMIAEVAMAGVNEALVLTSFHQSPLPLALLLRLAGVDRIGATCTDYPGRLLDVRHTYVADQHEVEQSLSLAAAMGHRLAPGDDGRLRIDLPRVATAGRLDAPYVVVHPGASVPARGLPADRTGAVVDALVERGWAVVVTGGRAEAASAAALASRPCVTSIAGRTDLAELAEWVTGAAAVVCGNTGIAHVAAAVGTPLVQAYAPTVPARRWHPWRVPHVQLGTAHIPCAGCRARCCPVPGQPCLDPFTPAAVVDAVARLTTDRSLDVVVPGRRP